MMMKRNSLNCDSANRLHVHVNSYYTFITLLCSHPVECVHFGFHD